MKIIVPPQMIEDLSAIATDLEACRRAGLTPGEAAHLLESLEPNLPILIERSPSNMSSTSDDRQPHIRGLDLPIARGPLRERAAEIRCRYCSQPMHEEDDRENGWHADCAALAQEGRI